LYYIDGASCVILYFSRTYLLLIVTFLSFFRWEGQIFWNMSIFQFHIYHSLEFLYVNHDLYDIISFLYCPSMKWLPLLIYASQHSRFGHWRSIGLTVMHRYVTVLWGTWSYKNETIFLPYWISFRFYGTDNL